MRYLALIYHQEADKARMSGSDAGQLMNDYMGCGEEIRKAGVFRGGDALQPTTTATTVRVRNDEVLTTDGPFAETKEQLGGFCMLDCEDLDEALKYAAMIPDARNGSVEVRPILEFD